MRSTSLVRDLIYGRYDAVDRKLRDLLTSLREQGAPECWHKHGTFYDHLFGVYRILRLWGQSDRECHAGLFHSAYSNELVNLAIYDVKVDREHVARLVGHEAEEMVYVFCEMPRRLFIEELSSLSTLPKLLTLRDRGVTQHLGRVEVQAYAVLTLADLAEQWFDWQDNVWADHFGLTVPPRGTLLWPGPLTPTRGMFSVLSRIARHLEGGPLPLPPVFDRCTKILARDREAACTDLYMEAQQLRAGDEGHAAKLLERAIAENPFVGEPHLLLAQLLLDKQDYPRAKEHAVAALTLLSQWGTPFDKRISWDAWLAWAGVLVEQASNRTWPEERIKHNNVGLLRARESLRRGAE